MKDLTQGSITGHLLHLSAFLAVSMVFQTLYLLVDLYFVSSLGKEAIAGVSLSGNVMLIIVALTQTLGVGTTSLIAQAAGRRDRSDAQLVFNQSLVLSAITGALVVALGMSLRLPYCRAMSADEGTLREGAAYLLWFIPSLGMQFALVSMGSALRGTGIVKPTMAVQVLTVILNVILAPVLIAGWGTGRPLGVAGAALATLISVTVGVLALTFYFRQLESFVGFERNLWRPRPRVWKRIAAIGLPAGGEFAVLAIYSATVYWLVRGFGAGAQAGYGVGMRVMQSLFLPVLAISFAASPLAGQNFGAKLGARVRQTFQSAAILATLLMAAVTMLCQFSPEGSIRLFSSEDPVVAYGAEYLRIMSWGFVGSGLVFTSSGIFQALGNTWPSLASSVSRLVLFALPAVWLSGGSGFAPRQLWYLSVTAGLLQAALNVLLLRRELRRKLDFLLAAQEGHQ
ncbi:MAG: MATE family efflux transporter [Bryobacteraceae bacterium]|nr:MATE family efflux transporter [Bryobacteraceae bacterium]